MRRPGKPLSEYCGDGDEHGVRQWLDWIHERPDRSQHLNVPSLPSRPFEFDTRGYTGLISAAQKIKKLSETPATVPIVAKLCMFDSKNRKIAEKLVQPVTPHLGCFQWGLQWGNS